MPGHDIIIVEGYRKSGLPAIEVMRAANASDSHVAQVFLEAARTGRPLSTDFVQAARGFDAYVMSDDVQARMPTASTIALVSDIPEAIEAAGIYDIPVFGLNDISAICDYLEASFLRPKISVVIQAGGESRRMGQSKALVPFCDRPLICRLIERLAPVADELIITTNEGDKLEFLYELYPDITLRLVPDVHDYRGALPGLCTALSAAHNSYVAVVACDMLFASARLVVAEASAMKESAAAVVVPVNKHGFEPFHAMYDRDKCLPAIEKMLACGDKRAQAFFDAVKVREFTQAEVLLVEPMGGCFINANTPEELHAWEDRLVEM